MCSHLLKNNAQSARADTKSKPSAAIESKKNGEANSYDAALNLLDAGTSTSNFAAVTDERKSPNFSAAKKNPAQKCESNSSVTSEETSALVSMVEDIVTKPSPSSQNQPIIRRRNKRPATSKSKTAFADELSAKKAKIKHALAINRGSTTFVFPKRNSNSAIYGNFRTPRLSAPAIPVIARLSPADTTALLASSKTTFSSSVNNRNSIHGRKTISIREQQEKQIGRAHEVIKRLKAEQRNKGTSSQPRQRPRLSTVNMHSAASESVPSAPHLRLNQNQTF